MDKPSPLINRIIPLILKRQSRSIIKESLLSDASHQLGPEHLDTLIDQATAILTDESLFMVNVLRDLPPTAKILDLGSHGGSFDYSLTQATIIAVDLNFGSSSTPENSWRILSDAHEIPIKDHCIDFVVASHTLEHFDHINKVLQEVSRIIKKDGKLWVAIPDGFSFDDKLYRFTFHGGGHLNKFSLNHFCDIIRQTVGMSPTFGKTLYTGFKYLYTPTWDENARNKPRAKIFGHLPVKFLDILLPTLNYLTRLSDRCFNTMLSRYGWEFLFEFKEREDRKPWHSKHINWVQPFVNVCPFCGNGHMEITLMPTIEKFMFWQIFTCTTCGRKNFFSSTQPITNKPCKTINPTKVPSDIVKR